MVEDQHGAGIRSRLDLDDFRPADAVETARLDELTRALGVDVAEAVGGPEILVHKRLLPVRTTQLAASLPAWSAGLQPERTIGPIHDRLGRPVWFDIFRRVRQVRFTRAPGSAPFLALPMSQIPQLGIGVASNAAVRLRAGSLWIASRLLAVDAPTDAYTGVRIAGGTLRFSHPIALVGDDVIVPPGVVCEAELELEPPAAPGGTGPGQDVREARFDAPRKVTLVVIGTGATISIDADPDADVAGLRVYGQSVGFRAVSGPAAYLPRLNRVAIPLTADAVDLTIGVVRSAGFRPSGTAPITASAWALPVARLAPVDLGEASGVGALMLGMADGLSATWTGQVAPVRLGQTVWLLDEARLSAHADTVGVGTSTQVPRLPDPLGRSQLRLDWTEQFALQFVAQATGHEAVITSARVEVAFEQPIDVAGDRVAFTAPASVVAFIEDTVGRQLWISAEDLPLGEHALAFGLTNALLRASLPVGLTMTMAYDGVIAGPGELALDYELQSILASLPDPYAANEPGWARQRSMILVSLVRWTADETTLEFLLPPGVQTPSARLDEGAAPARPAARGAGEPPGIMAFGANHARVEGGRDEMATAMRAVADALDFEATPRLVLLDVSTRVSQFGVALRPPTRHREVRVAVTGTTDAPLRPFAVHGLDLAADGRLMVLLTLPAVQWEPVEAEATGDDPSLPSRLRFDNSGVPTVIDVPTVHLVPVTPEAALDAIVNNFDDAYPQPARARLTLPFGMVAQATLRSPGPGRGVRVSENRPSSADGLQAGRQLQLHAEDPSLGPDRTPAMPGFTVQLPVAHPGPRSPLGASVTTIFNTYFGNGGANPLVPVTRLGLSGFGESLFSAWSNPGEELPQVSKAEFDVLVGRTAYEVVQVKTFLLPFFVPVVKTITFTRRSNGTIYRHESDWTALADGRYTAPPASGIVTHPGVLLRMTRVVNIRETGRRITHGGIELAEVRYSGDIELEGANPRLVPASGHVGFVQLTAAPLTAAAYAALLAAEGSLCGPLDTSFAIGGGPQVMRVHRIGVGVTQTASGPEMVMAVWGSPVFPGGGEWTVLRAEDSLGAPGPVPAAEGLPLIRAGSAGAAPIGAYRFADPADLARAGAPEHDYGILHATGTQRAFFRRPVIEPTDLSRIVGTERPVIADPYVLATALGPFPRQSDAIPFPAGPWALAVGAGGHYRLEAPGGGTFPSGVGRRTMRQAGSVHSDLDYSASVVTYQIDTAAPEPWHFALTAAKRIMNHTSMGDLMSLTANIEARAGQETSFREPQLQMGGALEIVQDVLTILADLGIVGTFTTAMTNGWSLKANLKVPIVKANGEDFTIPPVKVPGVNYALVFADFAITVENDVLPTAQSCTLVIGGSPMFGTTIYGLYVVIIVKFQLKISTDAGTSYVLLIGIGIAYKVEAGPFELKGLLALTFFAVSGDAICGYGIGFLVKVSLDLSPIFSLELSLEGKLARITVRIGAPDETVFGVAKLTFAAEVSVCLVFSISFELETKQVSVLRGPLGEDALPDVL